MLIGNGMERYEHKKLKVVGGYCGTVVMKMNYTVVSTVYYVRVATSGA